MGSLVKRRSREKDFKRLLKTSKWGVSNSKGRQLAKTMLYAKYKNSKIK